MCNPQCTTLILSDVRIRGCADGLRIRRNKYDNEENQKKLIKWLGGITVDEYHKVLEYKYIEGKNVAYERILIEMEEVYGMSADEWCKAMYALVKNQYGIYRYLVGKYREEYYNDR